MAFAAGEYDVVIVRLEDRSRDCAATIELGTDRHVPGEPSLNGACNLSGVLVARVVGREKDDVRTPSGFAHRRSLRFVTPPACAKNQIERRFARERSSRRD
jgi:hypothetical protein